MKTNYAFQHPEYVIPRKWVCDYIIKHRNEEDINDIWHNIAKQPAFREWLKDNSPNLNDLDHDVLIDFLCSIFQNPATERTWIKDNFHLAPPITLLISPNAPAEETERRFNQLDNWNDLMVEDEDFKKEYVLEFFRRPTVIEKLKRVDHPWRWITMQPQLVHLLEACPEKIDWECIAWNPAAMHIIEKNLDKIDWTALSFRREAIHLLEANQDKIDWRNLCSNTAAIHLLEANPDKIDWSYLSENRSALHLLEKNLDKVDWSCLMNNPMAIGLIEANVEKLRNHHWRKLSELPWALRLLEKNLDKVDWHTLSSRPWAIHLLEKNLHRVSWYELSSNKAAYHLLESNQHQIDWEDFMITDHPGTYDFNRIHKEHSWLREELTAYFYHPDRIRKWIEDGNELEDYVI